MAGACLCGVAGCGSVRVYEQQHTLHYDAPRMSHEQQPNNGTATVSIISETMGTVAFWNKSFRAD